jgi:predicted DNA-binding transcriptional regulator YafY
MDKRLPHAAPPRKHVLPLRGRSQAPQVVALLHHAMQKLHRVSLVYEDRERVVEPHIHGINTQGHEMLSAYQVRGGSRSNDPVGWKTFQLDKMRDLIVLDETFTGPRREYNPADKSFVHVYARL